MNTINILLPTGHIYHRWFFKY